MTIILFPKEKNTIMNERRRETFGMFKDDETFNEMVEAGRPYREALRKADREEAEDGEA
jgi:hypothetical protein